MKTLIHSKLIRITQASLLESAGSSMIGIFIPLLLINQGLAIYQICMFYAVYSIIKLLTNYPITRLIHANGARFGLLGGYTLSSVFIVVLSLYIATDIDALLYALPAVMAFRNTLLWNSEHLQVSGTMDPRRKGKDFAYIANAARIIAVVAPLIGGLIALTFGGVWLTIVAALMSMLALIPAWHIPAHDHSPIKTRLMFGFKGAPAGDLIGNVGFGIHAGVGLFLWPIYLAVFIPDFKSIAAITAVSAGLGIVVVHIIGKRSDSGKSFKVLAEGTGISSLAHILRVLVGSNPVTITAVSSLFNLGLDYQFNPWKSIYYSHARRRGINYIMSMELAGDAAHTLLWTVVTALSYYSSSNEFFAAAFVLAATSAWLSMFMTKEK